MFTKLISGVLPAVIAIGALWTAGSIAQKAATQNASATWPSVSGVVIESEILAGGTSENIVHQYAFRCAYKTRKGSFDLDQITRFGHLGTYFRGGPGELAEVFQPGDVVTVFFKPNDHSVAVVGTGLTRGEMLSSGAIILALVAVGLACSLAALEPVLSPMVSYRPVITGTTGDFNRGPSNPKPVAYTKA